MKRRIYLYVILIAYLSGGCTHSKCHNLNPVIDQYGPNDQPYKTELVKVINTTAPGKIHYLIDKYQEINGKPFVSIYAEGDSICAQMFIDIKNPNKMAHFKTVKGIAFKGKEIKGLQFHTDTVNGAYYFIFEEGNIDGKKQ